MEIKIYKSPWKSIKMIALCSVFVGLGIFGIATGSIPSWVCWLNICFFGLAYPLGFYQLLDRRPQIILNEVGVFDRTIHKDFINWELIQGAYPIDINSVKFVCLVVDKDFKPSKHKGFFYKKVKSFSEAIGAQELNLNLGALSVNEVKLTELILAMRTATKPEREKLLALPLGVRL